MCVGERSGLNPEPWSTNPSALQAVLGDCTHSHTLPQYPVTKITSGFIAISSGVNIIGTSRRFSVLAMQSREFCKIAQYFLLAVNSVKVSMLVQVILCEYKCDYSHSQDTCCSCKDWLPLCILAAKDKFIKGTL